jgi:hypothetical protein
MKILMSLQIKVFVAVLFISLHAFSQKRTDSIEQVHNSPVKNGYIYYKAKNTLHQSIPFVNIYSKENDAFAVAEGKVERIFRMQDEDHVLIRTGDSTFQYSHLDSAVVKTGNIVRKGDLIGKVKKDEPNDRYELVFGLVVGTRKMVYSDYSGFLRKYNK